MRFIFIAALLAGALASPVTEISTPSYGGDDDYGLDDGYGGDDGYAGDGQGSRYQPCSKAGFFGNAATCCSFDIIGAASLGCKPRT